MATFKAAMIRFIKEKGRRRSLARRCHTAVIVITAMCATGQRERSRGREGGREGGMAELDVIAATAMITECKKCTERSVLLAKVPDKVRTQYY